MPYFLILAALAAAATAGGNREARLLNLSDVMSSEDYPLIALQKGIEGDVRVRLGVDKQGFVTSCKVVKSSNSGELDGQTCALFRARARFAPARDSKGRAVASTLTQVVHWKLAGEPSAPAPRQAWMLRQTLAFDAQGIIADCKTETTGYPTADDFCSMEGMDNPPSRPADAVKFVVTETYFMPGDPAKLIIPPQLRDATLEGRQVSRITIEPDGTIGDCDGITYSGNATPDVDFCTTLAGSRFEPAADRNDGQLVGTLVVSAYTRKQSHT